MNANMEIWPRPHRLTVDEYYRMAEVGLLAPDARVELIEGAIVDMAPIGSRHAAMVDRLAKRFIEAAGDAAVVRIQGPLRLDHSSEPQPDLALLKPCTGSYAHSHPGAKDALLVIEVSDTTWRFDRDVKANLYARHGIPELWIVELDGQEVHFFREAHPDGYARIWSAAELDRVQISAFCIDLRDLFLF